MRIIRLSEERFHTQIGWLNSRHTFSFGHHFDPRWRGFGNLLVLNDDTVAPGAGFGTHPHRDMEIVSYVVDGALEHRDSMGTGSVIRRGDVQRMSAGTGVMHSEYNHSKDATVRFLQLWFPPTERGIEPGYEQKAISLQKRRGQLRVLASQTGEAGSVTIHSDARLLGTLLARGESVTHQVQAGRGAWIHVVQGKAMVDGEALGEGDALAIRDEARAVTIEGAGGDDDPLAEVLVFDVL